MTRRGWSNKVFLSIQLGRLSREGFGCQVRDQKLVRSRTGT